MVDITYSVKVSIPERSDFELPNQSLQIGKEEYEYVDLDTKVDTEDEIIIQNIDNCNLLVIKVETPLPKESNYKLKCKIGLADDAPFKELDAPLFLVGQWIETLFTPVKKSNGLTMTFRVEKAAEAATKAVEAATKAAEAATKAAEAATKAADASDDQTLKDAAKEATEAAEAATTKAAEAATKAADAETAVKNATEKDAAAVTAVKDAAEAATNAAEAAAKAAEASDDQTLKEEAEEATKAATKAEEAADDAAAAKKTAEDAKKAAAEKARVIVLIGRT